MPMSQFATDILKFNAMYRMQIAAGPTLRIGTKGPAQRLRDFKSILAKELNELDPIIDHIQHLEEGHTTWYDPSGAATLTNGMNALTDLADLLGDIQVYCASEMAKFGIPLDQTLAIIMQSNFSKMFPDGPHFDEQDKLVKGPEYWQPEPQLRLMLDAALTEAGGPSEATAAQPLP